MKPTVRLTPGRLVYLGYYRPLSLLRQSWREGGPVAQWITRRGRLMMQQAAWRLPALPPPSGNAPVIRLMTGRRFWYQTAFCFWSLCRHAGRSLAVEFIDDGTLDSELQNEAHRLFPGCTILTEAETEKRLDAFLPRREFPALRRRREVYPNLRKLTDVHAGRSGWQLVLDSDMLFFAPPTELLDWLAKPSAPIYMTDVHDAYGYSAPLLASLGHTAIPPCLNVGICGLNSSSIEWNALESWTCQLEEQEGTSYYLEQALVALLLAGRPATQLPRSRYLLMPDAAECRRPSAVMHHYVDLSKSGYFRHAWRHINPPPDNGR